MEGRINNIFSQGISMEFFKLQAPLHSKPYTISLRPPYRGLLELTAGLLRIVDSFKGLPTIVAMALRGIPRGRGLDPISLLTKQKP